MDHVTAVYKTRAGAEEALRRMEVIGIADNQISILSSDETRGKAFEIEKGSKTDEGFAAGATMGGLVGAVIAGVLSAGAIAIPGMNLVVSGYLISALAGLGAGAATGGLIGALVGAGFEENEAKFYENELREGNILLAVKVRDGDQKKQVKEILDETDSYGLNQESMPGVRSDVDVRSARV
jgi:uncharacterized membrane protein